MARQSGQPRNGVVLRTYAELDQFLHQFAAGKFGLLIIVGRPGLQKSRNVRAVLGPGVCWIESNTTAFGMYCRLFEHRDEIMEALPAPAWIEDAAPERCANQFPARGSLAVLT